MIKATKSSWLVRQPQFEFNLSSFFLFIVLSVVAWIMNMYAQMIFPSLNLVPYLISLTIAMVIDLLVIVMSIRLLRQNCLPPQALGLSISSGTLANAFVGILIGVVVIVSMAGLLYIFVPYHFARGPFTRVQLMKAAASFIVGNSLEELIFRGFLFVVLSQLTNWRISLLIVALAFGLFHLQGIGFTLRGAKMVASTSLFGLVFGLSYVLTRSLWTAISTHIAGNLFLHTITGLDGMGRAIFVPVFEKPWPQSYDLGLLVIAMNAIIVSSLLYAAIRLRRSP